MSCWRNIYIPADVPLPDKKNHRRHKNNGSLVRETNDGTVILKKSHCCFHIDICEYPTYGKIHKLDHRYARSFPGRRNLPPNRLRPLAFHTFFIFVEIDIMSIPCPTPPPIPRISAMVDPDRLISVVQPRREPFNEYLPADGISILARTVLRILLPFCDFIDGKRGVIDFR